MSQPWRPRHKSENPWISHTVAAHKAAGTIIPYANRYPEPINDYNSNNSIQRQHGSPPVNISIRIQEARDNIERIRRGESTHLILYRLGLTDLSDFPGVLDVLENVTYLACEHNPITDLPNFRKKAPKLVTLHCNNTLITELPPLPDTLKSLNCSSCNSKSRNRNNPNGLRKLSRPLPPNLVHLNCSSNALIYLPPIPSKLELLLVEHNQLKELPQLPDSLRTLYINNNQLRSIPKLPPILAFIKAFENPLGPPFNEPPLNILLNKTILYAASINMIRPIIKDYWDNKTVETLGAEMVNPESYLSAATGKRTGYGFPVGPNVSLLKFLNISEPQNKKSFNQTRANLRTRVNPNPLSTINTELFKGGTRRRKRSKYTRRK